MSKCPDCGVKPDKMHYPNCGVARCPECGRQMLSCGCEWRPSFWSGEWPGVMECREFGWYARLVPGRGWAPCGADHPEAHPDLNRLYIEAQWDRDQERFVLRGPSV